MAIGKVNNEQVIIADSKNGIPHFLCPALPIAKGGDTIFTYGRGNSIGESIT